MCCVCAGLCSHVGNHSYCAAHGGTEQPAMTVQPSTSVSFTPIPCNHCWCKAAAVALRDKPHRQCCKCSDVMAEEFVTER
jgi:hypothetical protein